jgi:SpoVK/Ycf46/Vps4 family AAA+-type ATPase
MMHHDDDVETYFGARTSLVAATYAMRSAADDVAVSLLETCEALSAQCRDLEARSLRLPSQILAERLELTESELNVIWLLAAVEAGVLVLDGSLSTTLIRELVYGGRPATTAMRELGAQGVLRRLSLIERSDGLGETSHESKHEWALSHRILAWLYGESACDPAIEKFARVTTSTTTLSELAVSPGAIEQARRALSAGRAMVIVSGMPSLGRRTLLRAAATEAQYTVLEIDCRRLAQEVGVVTAQLRSLVRECRMLQCTPLLANLDALAEDKDPRMELIATELVAQLDGLVLGTSTRRRSGSWDRPVISIEMQQPDWVQLAALWRAKLGVSEAETLAERYPLAPGLVHHASLAVKACAGGKPVRIEHVQAGITSVLDDRLGRYARRVTVTQSWDDLVLPQDQLDVIMDVLARVRERRRVYESWGFAAKVGRGLGVSALFSGPPGTGKTMVAALIARDLGLDLFQVDLGKVVSKWIGETEKNLGALFDAAETGHAILLFDEADSLFGKRTDVKSSNDRYANLETNYLLQRLETFTGICFLTSNHESNMDPAFQRRLSVHLRFDVPDVEERMHLWATMLPKQAPTADGIDFRALADKFEMSGGYIRNAALRAAFLAADRNEVISAALLERAAKLEYEAIGKIAFEASRG